MREKKNRCGLVLLCLCMVMPEFACNGATGEQRPTAAPMQEAAAVTGTVELPDVTVAGAQDLSASLQKEADSAKIGEVTYFSYEILYPVYEGEEAGAMNAFIQAITAEFRENLPFAREQALVDYQEAENLSAFPFPETEELSVRTMAETEEWLSFLVLWYSDTGGAHPNSFYQSYVVKKKGAEEITIDEVLSEYSLSVEETAEYAAEKVRTAAGEELEMFWEPEKLEASMRSILEKKQWYLTENGLVLFANPYELAAYVYGTIECEISYEELQQGLKKD